MRGSTWVLLLAVLLCAAGFWVGHRDARSRASTRESVALVVPEVAAPADSADGPAARRGEAEPPRVDAPAPVRVRTAPSADDSERIVLEPLAVLDLSEVRTTEEAFDRILRWWDTKLRQGRAGHLELLAWFAKLGSDEGASDAEPWFMRWSRDTTASTTAVMRLLRYVVQNEERVAGLAVTMFRQAAEDPAWFEDKDSLDFDDFGEGPAFLLPAFANEQQMASLRESVQKILDTPEGTQPKAIRRGRLELQRLLLAWTPLPSPLEALERIRSRKVPWQEALHLLSSFPAKAWQDIDLFAVIEPYLEEDPTRAFEVARRLPALDGRQVERIDAFIVEGIRSGRLQATPHQLESALGNRSWPDARGFLMSVAALNESTANAVGNLAGRRHGFPGAPNADDVRWLVERTPISTELASRLRAYYGLDR